MKNTVIKIDVTDAVDIHRACEEAERISKIIDCTVVFWFNGIECRMYHKNMMVKDVVNKYIDDLRSDIENANKVSFFERFKFWKAFDH